MGYIKAESSRAEYEVNSVEELEELIEEFNNFGYEEAASEGKDWEDLNEDDFSFTLEDTHSDFRGEEIRLSEIDRADTYMDDLEYFSDEQMAALFYLTEDLHYGFMDAMAKHDDVIIMCGDLEDAAEEDALNLNYRIPNEIQPYINWLAYGEDMVTNGEWGEISYNGRDYVILNSRAL